jgi:hypothetical protein
MDVGLQVEGIFKRKFEHTKKDGEIMGIYEFETEQGDVFQLIGCGSLNYQFEKIEVDSRVLIEYFGKLKSKDPKKNDFHSYKVKVWKD